jgi:alkylated DNA repair protein (DNA oxidative demethylase)
MGNADEEGMMADLFTHMREDQILADGAVLLANFALAQERELFAAIEAIAVQSPFRHMVTPRGFAMSVAMTNAGHKGWVSDRKGYRYTTHDPQTGMHWPAMPELFRTLAATAASKAGYAGFRPDACLINRYVPGTKLSLHQDKDEQDLAAPIVSVSLGLPAVFLFGGKERNAPTIKVPLEHGDVVVWGGASRLAYHGIMPLKEAVHPLAGAQRLNLTFRKL